MAICLATIACTKENTSVNNNVNIPTITAGIVDEDATKTHIDGLNVTWSEGDMIKLISHDDYLTSTRPIGTYTLKTGAGTKSATFEMTSGNAPVITASNKFYALHSSLDASFEGGGSASSSNLYGVFRLPASQDYVEGGVADGLLPMWGYGASTSNIQFHHSCGIVAVQLYAKSAGTKTSKIVVNAGKSLSGLFYHDFYRYPDSHHCVVYGSGLHGASVTINFTSPLEISTNSASPTVVNFVLPAFNIPDFSVAVYDESGSSVFKKQKSSSFTVSPGVKHLMAPIEVDKFEELPPVYISVGSGAAENIYAYSGVPSGNVVITAGEDYVCSVADMGQVSSILSSAKKSTISLDLSAIDVNDNTFSNWFAYCTSLYEVKLPTSLTSLGSATCIFPSTIVNRLDIPEGVTSIAASVIQKPVCVIGIPSTMESISLGNAYTCTGFDVAAGNAKYSSEDGVLFNADKTVLYYYPGNKTGTSYSIPSSVTQVGSNSFQNVSYLEHLIVPSSVISMKAPFSNIVALNTITLQGTSTDLTSMTYSDEKITSLFKRYGGTINAPTGCAYYRNHSVWSKFKTVFGWTFNDGCAGVASSASIGAMGASEPSFEW